MLNTVSKLYEGMLKEKLEGEIYEKQALSDMQYDFRKGRSTIQAVQNILTDIKRDATNKWGVLAALEVKNAFNILPWQSVLERLRKGEISKYLMNVVAEYLRGRYPEIEKGYSIRLAAGDPQG